MSKKAKPQNDKTSKTEPQADAKSRSPKRNDLPTTEVLASLAAIVSKDFDNNPNEAVGHAIVIWKACQHRLELETKEQEGVDLMEEVEAETAAKIPMPNAFPASSENFLRLVVIGKTRAEKAERFSDFLSSSTSNVTMELAACKENGFADAQVWLEAGERFGKWWADHKSKQSRKAAKSKVKRAE